MSTIQSPVTPVDIGQQLSGMFSVPAPSAAAVAAGTSGASSSAISAGDTEDRFLKLLVAQMRNQDPLNPLDNAQVTTQLAQISTVQGIEELNRTVARLAGGTGVSSPIDAIGMIGREVLTQGGGFEITDEAPTSATAGFELEQAAEAVQIAVVNAAGESVYNRLLGPTAAGTQLFQWTPAGLPPGPYELKVQALAGGQVFAATPLTPARVLGVSQANDGVRIEMSGRASVLANAIKAIL